MDHVAMWNQIIQALKVLKKLMNLLFNNSGNANKKLITLKPKNDQQMKQDCPAPPYTDERNRLKTQSRTQ